MALDSNDLSAIKNMLGGHEGMSPFEQVKVGYMQAKRPSGVGITGLVLGTVGTALAIGAWIFGPTYGKSQAERARDVANARYDANQNQLNLLTQLLAAERNERVAQGYSITQTVNDTVSGSQQGTLTAQQAAELSSVQSVQNQLFTQAVMGNLSENAQKVQIYSAPQPCACPGCGCNG